MIFLDAEKQKKAQVPRSGLSALDVYYNRACKIIILTPSIAAFLAAVTFTVFKALGWYPGVSTTALAIFDLADIFCLIMGIAYLKIGFDEDGALKPDTIRRGKWIISVSILLQWNYISYMIPSREFWGFAPFFLIFAVFLFDMRMMLFTTTGIAVSITVSWIVNGENLFVAPGEYFLPDAALRVVCLSLTLTAMVGLTYFGGRFLVGGLEQYANRDTLTNLLNRRSMGDRLDRACGQAAAGKGTFCLLMLDIDDFKKVNDTYGHDCGDEVLRTVANAVTCNVKKNDSVFRWGGEEILILFTADEEKAIAAGERIRRDIERDPVNYRNETEVFVTVTIGIAPYREGASVQALMDDADAKLYWGKRHGKNRVVSVLPDEPENVPAETA